MFVRFRPSQRRLAVSLIVAARHEGKPRNEHVGGLGSVPQPPSVPDRVAFWGKLHDRLAALANRIDAKAHLQILDAIHARIPMPTAEEQRQAQLAHARAEAEVFAGVANLYNSLAGDQDALAAKAAATAAANRSAAASAAEIASTEKEKIERLERGEAVAGRLGKPTDIADILRRAGMTKADMRRAIRTGGLSEAEFAALVEERQKRQEAVHNWFPRPR